MQSTVQIPCGFQTAVLRYVLHYDFWSFLFFLSFSFSVSIDQSSGWWDAQSSSRFTAHLQCHQRDAHCCHYPGPAKLLLSGVNLTPAVTLWPFTFHFTPPPALHLSQMSWRCFCMICMFLPHQGDFTYCFLWRLNQKLYFIFGHFASFMNSHSKESR